MGEYLIAQAMIADAHEAVRRFTERACRGTCEPPHPAEA